MFFQFLSNCSIHYSLHESFYLGTYITNGKLLPNFEKTLIIDIKTKAITVCGEKKIRFIPLLLCNSQRQMSLWLSFYGVISWLGTLSCNSLCLEGTYYVYGACVDKLSVAGDHKTASFPKRNILISRLIIVKLEEGREHSWNYTLRVCNFLANNRHWVSLLLEGFQSSFHTKRASLEM